MTCWWYPSRSFLWNSNRNSFRTSAFSYKLFSGLLQEFLLEFSGSYFNIFPGLLRITSEVPSGNFLGICSEISKQFHMEFIQDVLSGFFMEFLKKNQRFFQKFILELSRCFLSFHSSSKNYFRDCFKNCFRDSFGKSFWNSTKNLFRGFSRNFFWEILPGFFRDLLQGFLQQILPKVLRELLTGFILELLLRLLRKLLLRFFHKPVQDFFQELHLGFLYWIPPGISFGFLLKYIMEFSQMFLMWCNSYTSLLRNFSSSVCVILYGIT